jgi:hypothetical protein
MKLRTVLPYVVLGALATAAQAEYWELRQSRAAYTVEFLATVNGANVESFEVSRVLAGVDRLALVYVSDAFVSAAQKDFSVNRWCELGKEGERRQCFTYYLYDPLQPTNVRIYH